MEIWGRFKGHDTGFIGIPTEPWTMATEQGDKLRFYVIVPVKDADYCDVNAVAEETEEWKFPNRDKSFTNRALLKDEYVVVCKSLQQDLYYVWDDGADEHMDRAKRIYQKIIKERS